jgi:hypothetical protein
MTTTYILKGLAPVVLLLALVGCDSLTVPDYNNPGLGDVQANPDRSNLATQATGLIIGLRAGQGGRAGYVSEVGIIGRESFNFDAADPRFATELLRDPLNGGNGAFGGNHWVNEYANIRAANELLAAVDAAEALGDIITSQEGEALRGFAKTIQATSFLLVINTRDDLGAPIDVAGDPTGPPAPIVSKSEVLAHIATLLNDAEAHLQTAGSTDFPFPLGRGFSGFDTPATFTEFNRALTARVEAYRENWSTVLTALEGSFLDDSPTLSVAGLEAGVYHTYSQGPGDVTNGLFDPSNLLILAHPQMEADALAGDERAARKITAVPTVQDQAEIGLSSNRAFTIYTSLEAPIPIIRNEELILLRAEANLQLDDDAAALTDVNLIRRQSGGVTEIAAGTWSAMTDEDQLDELLYNRRYSLMFEGHRWIDMRRYGRLGDLLAEDQVTGLTVHPRFPFPVRECDARDPAPSQGC